MIILAPTSTAGVVLVQIHESLVSRLQLGFIRLLDPPIFMCGARVALGSSSETFHNVDQIVSQTTSKRVPQATFPLPGY